MNSWQIPSKIVWSAFQAFWSASNPSRRIGILSYSSEQSTLTSPRNLVEEDSQGGTLVSQQSIALDENRAALETQNAFEAGRDAGAPRQAAGDPRLAASDPRQAASDPRLAARDPRQAAGAPRQAAGAPRQAASTPGLATLDPPLTKTAATAPKQTISYLPALDGLRAISILLVLGFHSIGPASAQIGKFFNGWVGVDVFFVISGYLITSILLKESSQNADGSFSLKKFYIRRSLRIAPAYYTFLLVALAFQCWTGNHHAAPYMYAAFYLTNLNMAFDWGLIPLNIGLNHLWSLAMEEQFYLLWPASLRVLKQHATTAVAGIIAAVYFWRIYLVESGAPWLRLTAGFDTKLDTIMLGVLLALLFVNKSFRENVGKLFGSTFAQIALFALTAASFAWLGHPQDGGKSGQLLFWALKMPASLGLICLSICSILTAPYGLVSKFLSNPLAVWIGRLSYSIYLWHMLVHVAFCMFFPTFITKHSGLAELTQFALILVASAASYYVIEQPFLKLKSKFS